MDSMLHNFCALCKRLKAKPGKAFAHKIAFFDTSRDLDVISL
jgi:hypothetical protein